MESNFATSFYYAFSTTAQVLAAFLALSGVFLIFKIQEIKRIQLNRSKYVYSLIRNFTSAADALSEKLSRDIRVLARMIESENQTQINNLLNSILSNTVFLKTFPKAFITVMLAIEMIKSSSVKLSNITYVTKVSIIFGCISILFSITFLSFIHIMTAEEAYLFFFSVFICAFISICAMVICIFKSLKDANVEELTEEQLNQIP